jgi:hypothetical protein
MSGSRTFRPTTVSGGNNIFWQKRTGNNFTIELIPETGINSVFITKNLQVANEITVTSSEKEKELNPKQYNYNNDSKLHFGLIAEDVEKVYPNLVSNTEVGKSLNYLEIVPLLIDKIKDLQNQIDELKRK